MTSIRAPEPTALESASRRLRANAIRALAMDAVQRANSGHPGAPMGLADVAEVLWHDWLSHAPTAPAWPDRDRFVLSNGHASMLLYALLHLSGYDLPMEQLQAFRQLGSRTPGHPEHGLTPGVETTTGPLGQGLANAVGMALAERVLAARYNRPGHTLVDHHTWCIVGDGCLMEGISHEACSLAGTLGLGKLIVLYDDNGISIDGEVEGWFTDDTVRRFEAYGWHVQGGVDGHDPVAIHAALAAARAETARPSLVGLRTVIGYGAPAKQGSESCHGSPLGAGEVAAARERLGWPWPPFEIPPEVRAGWDAREAGRARVAVWEARRAAHAQAYPELAEEYARTVLRGELPAGFAQAAEALVAACVERAAGISTRKASLDALGALGPALPELFGGSADLAGSNFTLWSGSRPVGRNAPDGNYVHYGVREFAMVAMMNGIALHGGLVPYGGTFLVFSDYARNALRLAALMGVRGIHVLTHDSIGVGEDGPTHQPVEHVASLRLIPGLHVWRPCDAVETAVAWRAAVERSDGPSALVLTRQNVPHQTRDAAAVEAIVRGGYVLLDCDGPPEALLLATGSEVGIAVAAARRLAEAGRRVRVVSLPCLERFAAQPREWRDAVLPPAVRARVAVEAGATAGWHALVGLDGAVIGLDRFGESAPGDRLYAHFGFTTERLVDAVQAVLDAAPSFPTPTGTRP